MFFADIFSVFFVLCSLFFVDKFVRLLCAFLIQVTPIMLVKSFFINDLIFMKTMVSPLVDRYIKNLPLTLYGNARICVSKDRCDIFKVV